MTVQPEKCLRKKWLMCPISLNHYKAYLEFVKEKTTDIQTSKSELK